MTTPKHNPPAPTALAVREGALPAIVETTAVAAAAQVKAAVETRYLFALQRPRNWKRVEAQIQAACQRPGFAEEAKYRLPRGDKHIEGLSVRFAEEAVRWLGNVMVEAVVVFDDDDRRIVRVTVTDLEANLTYPTDVVVAKTVERRSVGEGRDVVSRRTNSQNQPVYQLRATDDEILMKQNSLVSKALRNGVLRLLPADMQEAALVTVAQTIQSGATGAGKEGAVDRLLRAFARLDVSQADLEGYLNHGIDTLTPVEFEALRGLGEAMREGLAWEDVIARTPKVSQYKREPAVKRGDYEEGRTAAETRTVQREEIDMATKPVRKGKLPDDPYLKTAREREPGEDDEPAVGDLPEPHE